VFDAVAPQDSVTKDMNAEVDRQLILAVADGSAEALGRLYDRYVATVFGLARRIVSRLEDAEEVVQDVFTQVWREAGRYRDERASVAGWIVMLARTRAIDRLRARRARPDGDQGAEPEPGLPLASTDRDPEAVAISRQQAEAIRRTLEALPETQRVLIEMAYFRGLTHTEIAAETGVPLGTVKTRIRAAMETLRDVLQ
jgi:RNA polymerase sigma-70 factor (ECF subfamily)